jgi:hypothetical protein
MVALIAHAEIGLSSYATYNLTIEGGLNAPEIIAGINSIKKGRIGWGAFFLKLEENRLITPEDTAKLSALEISEQEHFLTIIERDTSAKEKADELANF